MPVSEQVLMEGLEEALSESLENMAFLELESGERVEEKPQLQPDHMLVSLDITKPLSGKFYLVFPEDMVTEMTETVAEDEAEEEMKKDVLSEMANTVAGRFLAHVFPKQEFEMGIPECCDSGKFRKSRFDNEIVMQFDAEGNLLYGIIDYNN